MVSKTTCKSVFLSRYKNISLSRGKFLKILFLNLIVKRNLENSLYFHSASKPAGKASPHSLTFFFFLIFLCGEKFQNFSYPRILHVTWEEGEETRHWFFILFFITGSGSWRDSGKVGNQFVVVFFSSRRKIGLEVLLVPAKADHRLTHTTRLVFLANRIPVPSPFNSIFEFRKFSLLKLLVYLQRLSIIKGNISIS